MSCWANWCASKLIYHPTVTREPFRTQGRLTDQIADGSLAAVGGPAAAGSRRRPLHALRQPGHAAGHARAAGRARVSWFRRASASRATTSSSARSSKNRLRRRPASGGVRAGKFAAPRAVCEPDRHHDRVLRLLHLRHRRGAGVSASCSFPASDPAAATLQSLATFALAFFARPVGSAVFGHYGDRIGRKATLVAALLTMGLSTVLIGLLPTYQTAGLLAPALLALCRFGQGFGLGGEWGGAVLLATENAPPGKHNWYGMFPQLGAPIGFICSVGVFLLLAQYLDRRAVHAVGLARAVPGQRRAGAGGPVCAAAHRGDAGVPRARWRTTSACACPWPRCSASMGGRCCWARSRPWRRSCVFYLMTVFALSWGTSKLGYTRQEFLVLQMIGVVFFGADHSAVGMAGGSLQPARGADRRQPSAWRCSGWCSRRCCRSGQARFGAAVPVRSGSALMGLAYGPLGAALAALFPTPVRYTGASLAFNLAGIVGRVADALCRDLAGNPVRPAGGGLLPGGRRHC